MDDIQRDLSTSFHIKEVNQSEIGKVIKELRQSKAKDYFGLDTLIIKKHSSVVQVPVTHVVNCSIRRNEFPEPWKKAIINPIHKSSSPDLVSNYRPISILPALSKILEKTVAKQLVDYLENKHLLHPKQFGFRARYSTELANCYLTETIEQLLDEGNVGVAVFLDLKKAFDTVNHEILQKKLKTFNFSDEAIAWFR